MRILRLLAFFTATIFLYACSPETPSSPIPPPKKISFESTGHYCGMSLEEHEGPKAQIILRSQDSPIWLTSINQAVAFTILPEEAKDIAVIYVHDMGKAKNWAYPEHESWINAQDAYFVIKSDFIGGMGEQDTVPFGLLQQAEAFVEKHGGQIITFDNIPQDLVLGSPSTRGH